MSSIKVRSLFLAASRSLIAATASLLASCGGGSSTPGVPPGPSFQSFPLSGDVVAMAPRGPITVGSDGALWLIAGSKYGDAGSLWRVTTSGAVRLEISGSSPIFPFIACTTGSDGAVWFSTLSGVIGRITPSGTVTSFPLPANAAVGAMTAGPGGVWFTDTGTHALGRITTAGVVTEYPTTLLPNQSGSIGGIALGSDGALWFTSYQSINGINGPPFSNNDRIGRYSPATGFSSFAVTSGSAPTGIAAGPDGALWYTEAAAASIGRITTVGGFSEHPLGGIATGITRGPDNALWFATSGGLNSVGEITTAGTVTTTAVPSNDLLTGGVAATPDGSLWLTSSAGVVHFTP